MRTVSVEQAMYLIRRESGPCLTFYLPTEVAGKETLQNPVRFKNLLKIIERQINESGDKSPADLLEKPRKLVEDYSFWQNQTRGLAVLVDKNSMHCFELPYPPKELAVLGQNFHLAPLLPLLASDDLFYLLALSQNEVRLFRCNRYGAERIVADTIPTSLAEALPYQDPERQLQVRTTGPTGGAVFHGHGAGGDGNQDKKDSIARFFRLVDEAVHHETREEPAPMVLAGVAELFPLYTAVTRNKEILEAGVEGNVEGVDGTELWGRARAIVQPKLEEANRKALARLGELGGTGRVNGDLAVIIRAAVQGGVESLFLKEGATRWGTFSRGNSELRLADNATADNEDVLNIAALETFAARGEVHLVPAESFPSNVTHDAIAILRKGFEYQAAQRT